MHSFSEQCLDMARSMLGHNLDAIQPDGTVLPAPGEQPRPDEPGHVAYALGEYYRATGETTLKGFDLVDLAARCITAQMFTEPAAENGLAYAALALLAFGPSKKRSSASTSPSCTAATTTITGRPSTSRRPSPASASASPRRTRPRA